MDRNFRVRVSVGIGMFAVSLLALYLFDGIPFKILFGVFSFVSAIELFSFFKRGVSALRVVLAIFELAFFFVFFHDSHQAFTDSAACNERMNWINAPAVFIKN